MSGKFRVTVWDPALILSQIVTVQSTIYFTFGIFIIIGSLLTGADLNISALFSYKALNFSDKSGIVTIISFVLTPLIGSVALWKVVQRTKQCLDFTLTAYFLHLLICWAYNGFLPNTLSWWLLTLVSITIMCVCGEFLCLKAELEDIPLLGTRIDA